MFDGGRPAADFDVVESTSTGTTDGDLDVVLAGLERAGLPLVFAGPSLRPADLTHLRLLAEERNRVLDLRPPVRRHDLAALIGAEAPRRTLMLDGEFGRSLAVSVTEVRALLFAARGECLGAFHLHVVVQATVGPAVVSSR